MNNEHGKLRATCQSPNLLLRLTLQIISMKDTCILGLITCAFIVVGTMDYNDQVSMEKAQRDLRRRVAEVQSQHAQEQQLIERANKMMYPIAQAKEK